MKTLPTEKYLFRDFPPFPVEIVKTEGCYLTDSAGKQYIDFLSGWCIGNMGWGIKEIEDAIKDFSGPNYVYPYCHYQPWEELAKLLAEITPGKLEKSFRATGGTEAVEIALRAAIVHTGRTKFLSAKGSYHGHSFAAMGVGDMAPRDKFIDAIRLSDQINPPFDAKAGEAAEKLLSTRKYAAYISEPIIINAPVVIPTQEYYDIVSAACKKYKTLLIMDEVATGFGRTGKLFGSEHYNLEPDIMCLGKAITGGYAPMGATIMTNEVAKSMEFMFSQYSTYGWHPISVAASLAALKYLIKRKEAILSNTNKLSVYFEQRLRGMKFRESMKLRIKGLAIGLEFEKEGYNLEIQTRCLQVGLFVDVLPGPFLTLFPSLVMSQDIAEKGLRIFESCL